ncbi:hypothetical protein NPN16_24845, partial [Vibrio parahaemolyticus]|nr:hypothetical protein [Vibrio parahaemolyticus]
PVLSNSCFAMPAPRQTSSQPAMPSIIMKRFVNSKNNAKRNASNAPVASRFSNRKKHTDPSTRGTAQKHNQKHPLLK